MINEKRETGNHLWIPERDRWCDIMQITGKSKREGAGAEVQAGRRVSTDKIYTRMKRFITKALSTYSKLITLSFAFILYHCGRFSLSCRVSVLLLGFGGGYLWQVCAFIFFFPVAFCEIFAGCGAPVDDQSSVSYLLDVTLYINDKLQLAGI